MRVGNIYKININGAITVAKLIQTSNLGHMLTFETLYTNNEYHKTRFAIEYNELVSRYKEEKLTPLEKIMYES